MNNDKHIIDTANQATGQVALAEAESSPDMPETLVQLQTPYHFEGKDYTEVNLAGLERLSTRDMIEAEKHLIRSGMFTPLPEMNMDYVCTMAAKAAGLPIEFFMGLPPREMVKVKNKVTNFFYGEE